MGFWSGPFAGHSHQNLVHLAVWIGKWNQRLRKASQQEEAGRGLKLWTSYPALVSVSRLRRSKPMCGINLILDPLISASVHSFLNYSKLFNGFAWKSCQGCSYPRSWCIFSTLFPSLHSTFCEQVWMEHFVNNQLLYQWPFWDFPFLFRVPSPWSCPADPDLDHLEVQINLYRCFDKLIREWQHGFPILNFFKNISIFASFAM